ncbi:phosphate ABC transporter substrate-binding protein PstS [Cryobacterium zhongshanensis]|uniref:Phosphate ABC transporter substrate-binding protein PstS n=1 Tax=Cryobacterium zhongshanensis TaxID=2928153 RepID=A0AA41UM29_9MICO|nr:phosphate ABC transporter substrate-binding protein PstS [Cryobacterium zhongshanensis]MCI4659421.1 phosphate ABC transporter substrate-binding protein PstS [Cryobacterium zhongshanensis]
MTPQPRWIRAIRTFLALTVVLVSVLSTVPAQAVTYVPITGSGSTWSKNALDQWRRNVASNYGMTVNYTGGGSSTGRTDFAAGTVDFAVSEIPFQTHPEDNSAPEDTKRGYAYMPIVAGGSSFMYNLKIGGVRVSNLRLSGEVVTKIFTGVITKWNDPAIQTDNPGLAMPDKGIVPVVRSDGSGSTAQFTLWMSKQHPDLWNAFCAKVNRPTPCGLTSFYPTYGNAKAQSSSSDVAGYVSQDYGEGAITYVEYSYALKAGFPVVKVLNAAGYYVEPTANSVAVALLKAEINTTPGPDYLTQILDGVYNNTDPRTYPLSSYSYMIVPTEIGGVFNKDKGTTLRAFAKYMLCEGQQQAAALGYSPLPMNLVMAGSDQIKKIPGEGADGVDFNDCNNPTFKPGDSPSSNQLAISAQQPAECDKVGTSQCVTGTAGAPDDTPTSGTGTPGTASNADTAAVAAAAAGLGTAAVGAAGSVYDENGALISGGGAGSTGVVGTAVASPFSLADNGWGVQQSIMLFAGVLLVGSAVLPPVLWRRLKPRGAKAGSR